MKRLAVVFVTAVCAFGADPRPLHVDDVIASVRTHYPPLLATLLERDISDADVLAAEGRFDTIFRVRADSDSLGYYSNRRIDAGIEQPLQWQGLTLSTGYRRGEGEFAPYDGKLDTRSLGEFRTGLRMPLLRDREIDSRRGELARSRIGRKLASLSIDQQKLVVTQAAISRYWSWVAAGRRFAINRDVLAIAEDRQKLLDEGVRAGYLPAIEAIENQRAILQRRSSAIDAERAFQQAAIELSLFLRDSAGVSQIAGIERVPLQFPAATMFDPDRIATDTEKALERRPEVARFGAQIDQADIDVQVARNAARPAVDVIAGFTNDSGSSASVRRGPQEFKAGLAFEVPFQNRTARGRQAAAEARQKQLEIRRGFLQDQIRAEVLDGASAVRASFDRLQVLGEEVRLSRELEEAERTRFKLGEGTLFILNLREQATLDAAVRETLAQADYQRAVAAYEYATGALLYR